MVDMTNKLGLFREDGGFNMEARSKGKLVDHKEPKRESNK